MPLFVCLVLVSATAQPELSSYRIVRYTDENGLPQNSVKAVSIDGNGFVWLCTEAGLVRFDGQRFTTFDRSALPISSNRIRSFVQGFNTGSLRAAYPFYALSEGGEYIGVSNDGLAEVDKAFQINLQKINPSGDGRVARNNVLSSLPAQFAFLPNEQRYFMAMDQGQFLVWYRNMLTYIGGKKTIYRAKAAIREMFAIAGNAYMVDSTGAYREIGPGGIDARALEVGGDIASNPGHFRVTPEIHYNCVSKKTFLYLDKCLYRLERQPGGDLTTKLLLEKFDFNDHNIVSVDFDERQGILYLGSLTKGLYLIRKREFYALRLDEAGADNVYYAQVPGPGRSILTAQGYRLGTDAKGTRAMAGNVSPFMNRLNYKYSMAMASDSTIWIGGGNQLYRLDKTGREILDSVRIPEILKSLFMDTEGVLWIGAENGAVYRLDGRAGAYQVRLMVKAKIGIVTIMGKESPGVLFLGTERGLYRLNIAKRTIQAVGGLATVNIRSFYTTEQGTWITTYGNGFYLLSANKLVHFPNDSDGYLANAHCISEDPRGFFWITTNHGLFQISKKQLIQYARDQQTPVYYLFYDKASGFETNEFNGGCMPCSAKLADGTVSFPSMDGLVWFVPSQVKPELPDRGIFVSTVREDGRKVPVGDRLELSSSFEQLRVQLATPYMGDASNIHMFYSLAGGSRKEKWFPVGRDLLISIPKIAYGDYRLVIKKMDGFEPGKYTVKVIRLRIPPAWFETWWFKMSVAGLFFGILLFTVKWRIRNLLQKEREESILRQYRLTNQVVAAVNHDIQTPLHYIEFCLEQINGYLQRQSQMNQFVLRMSEESLKTSKKLGALSKNLLDYIKLQHKESTSLTQMELVPARELVSDVLELFSSVAAFREVRLRNEVAGSFEVYSDRNLLSIIIHNLIDNALKIGSTEVVVSSGKEHGRKQLYIEDNAEGMPEDLAKWLSAGYRTYQDWLRASQYPDQRGIGLVIVKDLCVLMHISITVSSSEGELKRIALTFGQ